MTTIKLVRNNNGQIVELEVSEHSGYAEKGQDIVCAAVSALTQTALLGLVQYLKTKVEYKVSEGYLYLNLQGNENELTDAILETMFLGLREVAQTYKKYVRIDESRR